MAETETRTIEPAAGRGRDIRLRRLPRRARHAPAHRTLHDADLRPPEPKDAHGRSAPREPPTTGSHTFYLLYFARLGDRRNQEAYLELARRVPYKTVLRERLAPHAVEAMLFGASGLLELYRNDTYTLDLKRSFEYLAAKYGIEPMEASAWTLNEIRPANHPVRGWHKPRSSSRRTSS